MFRLYQSNMAESEYADRCMLSQQRACLNEKLFSHGCYHDYVGRSLCYFQQNSHIGALRGAPVVPIRSHFRQDVHENSRRNESIVTYLPFDSRLFDGKSLMFESFKNKFSEDSKQLLELKSDSATLSLTSPSSYSNASGAESSVTSPSMSSSDSKKSFTCPQCKYSTDRKNNLKRHVITMHFDCDRKLECCGTIFRSKAKLREHVTLFHKNGYRCLVCARMFCRKALLRRHMAVHSGKKDFHCEFCSYATSHKSNLERHQKVHAKSARLVYSHRKQFQEFERKFCSFKEASELRMDNSELRVEAGVRDINEETNNHIDINEEDISSDDLDGDHENGKVDDELHIMTESNFHPKDKISYEFDEIGETNQTNFVLYPNAGNILVDSIHTDPEIDKLKWMSFGSNLLDAKKTDRRNVDKSMFEHNQEDCLVANSSEMEIEVEELDDKVAVDDKENMDIDRYENSDSVTKEEIDTLSNKTITLEKPSNRKSLPRLCGLPYRCANCGKRFESQDVFNHHECEAGETCGLSKIEKSVSLVALILKQGKKSNVVSF